MQDDIVITRSNGRGSGGKTFYYIHPKAECINRSRRVGWCTYAEIQEKIDKCVKKWFYPKVMLYSIEGSIIGSNSKENALKEYWRRCDLKDVGKQFEVQQG